MADIKTKESLRSIKVLDRARRITGYAYSEAQKAKNRFREVGDTSYENESEFAGNKVERTARKMEQKTVSSTIKLSKKGFRRARKKLEQHQNMHFENKPLKQTGKGIKKAEKTARDAEKAAKAAKKTAEATAKASKRAAEAAKKAAETTARAVKAAAKAVVQAVKAIIAGIKALVAAIAAGGWVAVLIIVIICIVALVLAILFGWLIPKDSDYSIYTALYELKSEYAAKVEEYKHTEPFDELRFEGTLPDYKLAIALFAVKENLDPEDPKDLISLDENAQERLGRIFWDMTTVSYYVTNESSEQTVVYTDDDGEVQETAEIISIVVLTIKTESKDIETMSQMYRLSRNQKELLNELLSSEFEELWQALLNDG